MDLVNKQDKYFFIGIKGTGMSACACFLKQYGCHVVGSDTSSQVGVEDFLDKNSINYFHFDEFDFDESYTIVVGNSFGEDFPEVKKATQQGNKILKYVEVLGLLSKQIPSVAVTGTHGKTTTTTYTASVLNNIAPTAFLIGDGNGHYEKDSKYFVFEACEYKNNYFNYYPKYAIITNITFDHHDFFKTQEQYNQSFFDFSKNVTNKVVVCGDDERCYEVFKNQNNVVFYGTKDHNDIQARNVTFDTSGITFDLYAYGTYIERYSVDLFGEHNLLNILSSLSISYLEKLDMNKLSKVDLVSFKPHRRFEEHFINDQVIIDDHGHHPKELLVTMDSIQQKYPDKEIVVLFQPYTVARIENFYKEFATALQTADKVILVKTDVPPREKNLYKNGHVDTDIMLPLLPQSKMYDNNTLSKLATKKNCIIIFIGAGIYSYTKKYLDILNTL